MARGLLRRKIPHLQLGLPRASIAVAHALLVIAYRILQAPVEYHDLGSHCLDQLHHRSVEKTSGEIIFEGIASLAPRQTKTY